MSKKLYKILIFFKKSSVFNTSGMTIDAIHKDFMHKHL